MKLGQIVYDADNPEHTGPLISQNETASRISRGGGSWWQVRTDRIRQGNGRGRAKRATVQKKIAAARKYQPMSERGRRELRAWAKDRMPDDYPRPLLVRHILRLLDDLDELHRQAKERK